MLRIAITPAIWLSVVSIALSAETDTRRVRAACNLHDVKALTALLLDESRLHDPTAYFELIEFAIREARASRCERDLAVKAVINQAIHLALSIKISEPASISILQKQAEVCTTLIKDDTLETVENQTDRLELLAIILSLWHNMDIASTRFDVELVDPFEPPSAFHETFVHGGDPSQIKDKQVRKQYTEYLQERNNRLQSRIALSTVTRTREEFVYQVKPVIRSLLKDGVNDDEQVSLGETLSLESEEIAELVASLRKAASRGTID